MRVKVLVMAPHLGSDLEYVTQVDPGVEVLDGNSAFTAELVEQNQMPGPIPPGAPSRTDRDRLLEQADVLLLGFPVPRLLIGRTTTLRWAHHTQAGVSNLLRCDLWTSSVPLTSSRGAVGISGIAEYVMSGVFYFARGLQEAVRQRAAGVFDRTGYQSSPVAQATIGVVGLGGIGQRVAHLAKSVGMRVVANRRTVTRSPSDIADVDELFGASDLLELAAQSDYLVLCSQLTPETRKMIDRRVFAAMKDRAVLINIGRGELIDDEAMLEALKTGHLRGALLDVHSGESVGAPPRQDLLDTPGVLLTPHVSAAGDQTTVTNVKRLFAENLRRFLDGETLVNLVDRSRGY
jgi:glyoxylate/hydroxypyruvate reductase